MKTNKTKCTDRNALNMNVYRGNDLPQMLSMQLLKYSFNVHIIEGTAVKDIAMTTRPYNVTTSTFTLH